jgi:hypothetical protein
MAAAHLERASLNRTHLEGCQFYHAHLERTDLRAAHLEGANMEAVHLEAANLFEAHLEGILVLLDNVKGLSAQSKRAHKMLPPTDLRRAFLSTETNFNQAHLGTQQHGGVTVSDVRWGGVNLAVVDWSPVKMLGDERLAWDWRSSKNSSIPSSKGSLKERAQARKQQEAQRLTMFQIAVRANRQLSTVLRSQGINEDADRFAYRAQLLQRHVNRLQRRPLRYFGSILLDLISGYGYKPLRSVVTYLLVVLGFATAYFALTNFTITPFLPSHSSPLAWYESIVLSISSFHGRGLFPSGLSLGDPIAILAAFEAIIGLLIEITFIATFTQRFFAR